MSSELAERRAHHDRLHRPRPNEESKVTRTVTAPVFAAVSSWSVVQFVVP
ncbi:hypothetical protein [Kitasatospora aureofaciens]|nr:hypothetical protein [Kitasatospora aureofaciens]